MESFLSSTYSTVPDKDVVSLAYIEGKSSGTEQCGMWFDTVDEIQKNHADTDQKRQFMITSDIRMRGKYNLSDSIWLFWLCD